MELRFERVDVRGAVPHAIGVGWTVAEGRLVWSVANDSPEPVAVEAVAVVGRLEALHEPLRVLRHGYQSWSATSVATFRVDQDPSRLPGVRSLVLGMHHADQSQADPDELRSETVVALRDDTGSVLVAGFLGGTEHDGTFRVRPAPDGGVELWAEAFLGGAVLGPGEVRPLHDLWWEAGESDPSPLLELWADQLGMAQAARTTAPYTVGWCSWYHYFWNVSETDVRSNLAHATGWPFDVFQVDDGYQADIGDWLTTNDRFPSELDALAAEIAGEGATPGIWMAPFLAGPRSEVAAIHPEWLARHPRTGDPLVGMVNPGWGGPVHALDTTAPEVLEHLEHVARSLVDAGFPYLKLDFTYAPSLRGSYADPSRTPAQRVRAGFDAIRRGAGNEAFLLGCGAPLALSVGVVDGMRIGADVAPWWHLLPDQPHVVGHDDAEPATVNAWRATLARSFMHRRLWVNDPDCLMLRTERTQMTSEQVRAWALAVGASGGMALVSDDLALLGDDAKALLDEVVALGREVDEVALDSRTPRCVDLMDADPPTRLRSVQVELVGDPAAGSAQIQGLLA